ncbi:LysR family transcriptional regulator [Asanoa sp. NPDC050611]|uniref:LysR family transcriptional regulator n=1 Tax=Asanoa sp. NPDC050611 TaxID=3157098 RepID=UPI0033CE27D0
MTGTYRERPSEWDYRVFIAVAETGTYEAAAHELAKLRGSYTRQSVGNMIRKIQRKEDEPLLQRKDDGGFMPTPAGERFVAAGREVIAVYERVNSTAAPQATWTLACAPHHTQFVAIAQDALRGPDGGADNIRVEYLDQANRGEYQFQRDPVERLARKEFGLLIGPAVSKAGLRSIELYSSQLEAMVDRGFRGDRLALADLVNDCEAFLQPHDIRARRVLDNAIRAAGLDPAALRVAAETYETGTSVMRLRTESARPRGPRRVMVVPSDVAQPYKEGMEFGGRNANRFKWVPVCAGADPLKLETHVTIRREDLDELRPVVNALKTGVQRLDQGRHPISGLPLHRGATPPRQRV